MTHRIISDAASNKPRYRLIKALDKGAFGEVFLADDLNLPRQVAIKLSIAKSDDFDSRMRFKREAGAISQLNHPNIATIFDYGETQDGEQFIAMELIKGHTLREVLRVGALPPARCIQVIIAIASALEEAHKCDIIHRDIKPGNVMLTFSGGIKVLDFGLAKKIKVDALPDADTLKESLDPSLTRKGIIIGTAQYMSPEQARGEDARKQSDLFSLGAVLYECLTGVPAFSGSDLHDVLRQVIYVNPPAPSKINPYLPAELDRITLKALAKDPAKRHQSAAELLADLRSAPTESDIAVAPGTEVLPAAARPVSASALTTRVIPLTPGPPPVKPPAARRRLKPLAVTATLLGAVLLALGGRIWWSATHLAMPSGGQARSAYEKGLAALRVGAYSQARKAFDEVIRLEPSFAGAHVRSAEALIELGLTEEAKTKISDARECRSPFDWSWSLDSLYLSAVDLTAFQKLDKAAEIYQRIVLRSPQDEQWVAENDLGRAYEKSNKAREALRSYRHSLELNPQHPRALIRLGALYGRGVAQNQTDKQNDPLLLLEQAESACKKFSSAQTECQAEVIYQRGVLSYLNNQPNRAGTLFNQALRLINPGYPNEKAPAEAQFQEISMLLRLGQSAYESGDSAQARRYTEEAGGRAEEYGLHSLSAEALVDLGNIDFDDDNPEMPKRSFRKALDLAKTYKLNRVKARANLALGSLLISNQDFNEGIDYVKPALEFYDRGEFPIEQGQALTLLGQAYTSKGEFALARQAYQRRLQLAIQATSEALLAEAFFGFASVSAEQEQYPEAMRQFQCALEIFERLKTEETRGWAFYSRMSLADVLGRLGYYAEAREMMEKADLPDGVTASDKSIVRRSEAALYLSREQWADALEKAREAEELVAQRPLTAKQMLIEAKATLGLSQVRNKRVISGLSQCETAIQMASVAENNLPIVLARVQLISAEAFFTTYSFMKARDLAVEAEKLFSKLELNESAWRASVVALLAADKLNDQTQARKYADKARNLFTQLAQKWRSDFDWYLTRSDVRTYMKQLNEISSTNNPLAKRSLR